MGTDLNAINILAFLKSIVWLGILRKRTPLLLEAYRLVFIETSQAASRSSPVFHLWIPFQKNL